MELIIAIVLAFVAGYLVACWRVSSKTGQSMAQVLRGGKNGEEGPP
jgi:hypothetical protein